MMFRTSATRLPRFDPTKEDELDEPKEEHGESPPPHRQLQKCRQRILNILRLSKAPMDIEELSELICHPIWSVKWTLLWLEDEGLVKRAHTKRYGVPQDWTLTLKGTYPHV